MWHSRLVTGEAPRNWKWKLIPTPEHWWIDYSVKHPEYSPYRLDPDVFHRVYGPGLDSPSERQRLDPHNQHQFMISHFGDHYKYYIARTRIDVGKMRDDLEDYWEALNRHMSYNPVVETPDAYQQFSRLSRLVDAGWPPKEIMGEVLRFVRKYGPPWSDWTDIRGMGPPFQTITKMPLTVDGILWQSSIMASVVQVYHLLTESSEDVTAAERLRQYLNKVTVEGGAPEEFRFSEIETETVEAAIAFIRRSVNSALAELRVEPGLAYGKEEGSVVGAWIPRYQYNDLLGAMWLQLCFEILDKARFRECAYENCRVLFSVTRSNKMYCSKKCGVMQYIRDHPKKRIGEKNERVS